MNILKLFKKPKYLITYEVQENINARTHKITLIINQSVESWFEEAEEVYYSIAITLIKEL